MDGIGPAADTTSSDRAAGLARPAVTVWLDEVASAHPEAIRRSLEAVEVAVRFAADRGRVGPVRLAYRSPVEAGILSRIGLPDLPLGPGGMDDGTLILQLTPGVRPAPSMLDALLRALRPGGRNAVAAREIPFESGVAGCRLGDRRDLPPDPCPTAVAFRDRRLTEEGRVVDPPSGDTTPAPPARDGRGPFLTVVMRTQGRRPANLEEALTCLGAQTTDDFEVQLAVHHEGPEVLSEVQRLVDGFGPRLTRRVHVFPVAGGGRSRPLNAALHRATGRYVAFLDDDDLVTADWVEAFLVGALDAPGSVVRAGSVNQPVSRCAAVDAPHEGPYVRVGEPRPVFARRFDLLQHLHGNSTPIFSFAIPRQLVAPPRAGFREDLPVLEDWDLLLRCALAAGVHDTGRCTGVYHWWLSGESALDQAAAGVWEEARRRILDSLDAGPLPLPPGSCGRIVGLQDELMASRRDLDAALGRLHQSEDRLGALLASRSWRITAPLRWASARVQARRPRH